jgi:hypothetical protein
MNQVSVSTSVKHCTEEKVAHHCKTYRVKIRSYELQSMHVTRNTTVCKLEKEIEKLLTSLLGTQIGVPSLTTPASIITPITIGSRELKMNCKA